MKKVFALILALVMVFAMSSVAFADSPITSTDSNNTDASEVKIAVNENKTGTIYYVVITWNTLDFTYNLNNNSGAWDWQSHTYTSGNVAAGWVDSDGDGTDVVVADGTLTRYNAITVTNHSNASVKVTPSYAATNEDFNVVVTEAGSKETLPSAEGYTDANYNDDALSATYSVAVSIAPGKTPTANASSTSVGTITITITANNT